MNESLWDDPELYELEGLLAVAGLQPLERRGGWNGEPLDAGARRYVSVCAPV